MVPEPGQWVDGRVRQPGQMDGTAAPATTTAYCHIMPHLTVATTEWAAVDLLAKRFG